MPQRLSRGSHIVVIDERPGDYHELPLLVAERGLHLHFLTSGAAAMEFAPRRRPVLWMINTRLPDMSGFDLVELLRNEAVCGCVWSVADRYHPGDEQQACCCGADLYLCKDATSALRCRPILDSVIREKDFNVLDGPRRVPPGPDEWPPDKRPSGRPRRWPRTVC